jgi:hypothetical protein
MPVINQTLTGCPADCDDALLYPAIPAEQDCPNYPQGRSQISTLYMLPTAMGGDIFASWGSTSAATPSYVANSIDNTNNLNAKAKKLTVIGELPVPEVTVTEYPLRKTRQTDKRFTIQATYYQLDANSYEFLRQVKCGKLNFTFYYADLAGYVYGIAGGLVPTLVRVTFPKGNGNADKNTAIIRLSFRATGSPQRRANPLA